MWMYEYDFDMRRLSFGITTQILYDREDRAMALNIRAFVGHALLVAFNHWDGVQNCLYYG